jgi:hypothetical protein
MIWALVRKDSLSHITDAHDTTGCYCSRFRSSGISTILLRKGRKDEALQILCDVYDRTPDHRKIVLEQNEILETLAMEREHGEYRWRNILVRDNAQTGR